MAFHPRRWLASCCFAWTIFVLLAGCGGGNGSQAPAPQAKPPLVENRAPSDLAQDAATVNASVAPQGFATRVWLEWSADPGLAGATQTESLDLEAGTEPVEISFALAGLAEGQTYFYRVVAESSEGTTLGSIDYLQPESAGNAALTVNCPDDLQNSPPGKLTLRDALSRVEDGGVLTVSPWLDGQTLTLTQVGEEHSVLMGEVYSFAAGAWIFEGYFERDYGRSALYARKSFTLSAETLAEGVTLRWGGGDADPARVLAVFGDVTLKKIHLVGGRSVSLPLSEGSQPHTLARGGGLAVWGQALLQGCRITDNSVSGDVNPSRDRGAFGGGIYGDVLTLEDCVVSGNAATGFGAAGGGVYSVGGVGNSWGPESSLDRCAVTGNRVTAQHAYGGGVYSDGGGPGAYQEIYLYNTTIARNLVTDHPGIAESAMFQYYCRGGGFYMSNGLLWLESCTVAENQVVGVPATFQGKPNLGGGGLGATIGNAHVVECMEIEDSILVGNTLNGEANDIFSGSLVDFYSYGYNLIGKIDFSQMLVPIPDWYYLSRKHWPKEGDEYGVALEDALAPDAALTLPGVASRGPDAGADAVLAYPPAGRALAKIPNGVRHGQWTWFGYNPSDGETDFLNQVMEHLRTYYADILGPDFGADIPDQSGVTLVIEAEKWPSFPENAPWISFWHQLDAELGDRLGPAHLGESFWTAFAALHPTLSNGSQMDDYTSTWWVYPPQALDQLGTQRPSDSPTDVGAVQSVPQ